MTISGPDNLTPHTLTITGTGVGSGITINSGAGLTTINSDLQLSGLSEAITVNNTAGLVINGIVGGTIGLTKAGTGLLTLTGLNTYSGGTMVASGVLSVAVLSVADDTNLGASSGGITLQSGELLTTGATFSSARAINLSLALSDDTLAAATSTTATYTGIVSGGGGLTVGDGTNTGTVVLTGTNTYGGNTLIRASTTLQIGNGERWYSEMRR